MERFDSRLGFSAIASSDMPLTKENGDLRPLSRSATTSISSIENFVKDHGVDVRSSTGSRDSFRVGQETNDRRQRSSSAGHERSHMSSSSAEIVPRRPASAGWSGGQGPVSSIEESTSLASLADFVETAVDVSCCLQPNAAASRMYRDRFTPQCHVDLTERHNAHAIASVQRVTADQAKARRQSKHMARLMSAGKRPELIRKKAVVDTHILLQKQSLRKAQNPSAAGSRTQRRQSTA